MNVCRAAASGRTSLRQVIAVVAVLCAFSVLAHGGELRLPAIFTDHAVLQQNAAVPVWGWAKPGAAVSVSVAGQTQSTTAGGDGRWRVDLASMTAGGPHELTVTAGDEQVALKDILIGEVWLASGQSNMQWTIKATDNWEEELARCENDNIRFAMIFREHSPEPLDEFRGLTPWASCNSQSMSDCYNGAGFSAVSYYFAKYLQAGLGVPVGIINTSWGGTRIEPWTPPAGFDQVPALADISAQVRINTPSSDEYQKALSTAISGVEAWLPMAKDALSKGIFPPALPAIASSSALNSHQSPTTLYNAMVAPMVPYANRGFIWYQGESNRGEGMLYRDKMEALIEGWRAVWHQDDLACYFVQLAPYNYGSTPQALPEIWEAQVATLDIPGTGMAVVNDIGNVADIHPRNKDDVGKRLAGLALNKTYGQKDIVCDSPLFDRFEVKGNAMRVYFKNAKSLKTRDDEAPNWFSICGPDGVYCAATAVIDGATVVLTSENVTTPVAVRFAWDHCAEPNLMSEAGLPASAFRAGEVPIDGAVKAYVPEAKDLEVVYAFDPTHLATKDKATIYAIDNHAKFEGKKIERIGYFMQLATPDEKVSWVYAEMDAFTQNINYIGVPVPEDGAQFQQDLGNLFVKSSENIPSGNLPSGAIEFWASNYGPIAARGLAGASSDKFDFDDTPSGPGLGYGCIQIIDAASGTVLMAFNSHRAGNEADVGIGNCTGEQPDWTFSKSAKNYASGQFLVLVKVAAE